MTELVTIEHDRYAIYTWGSPYARKQLLPHVKRTERFEYLIGETKPNFPVPSIYCLSLISDKVDERSWDVCQLDFALSLVRERLQ